MSTIIIGADIVPTPTNYVLFETGKAKDLLGEELLSLFQTADFRILNLEVPLTDNINPIIKNGANLCAPIYTINGLKAINYDFYTLANNHIMDQSDDGLFSTISLLQTHHIDYSGAGANITEARKPYVRFINGTKVGVYCCVEHEFSVATETSPGANPYDPLTSFDDVKELSSECDFTIVLYHGGKEHYRFPSPNMQRVFRKFADVGAHLVIAQHTHCVGCMEKYKESTLVYGQGNFLFDHSENECWQNSILIKVDVDTFLCKHQVSFIPIVKNANKVRIASESEANTIMAGFWSRSASIKDKSFITQKYNELAEENAEHLYKALSGKVGACVVGRILNRLSGFRLFKYIYTAKTLKPEVLNAFECAI